MLDGNYFSASFNSDSAKNNYFFASIWGNMVITVEWSEWDKTPWRPVKTVNYNCRTLCVRNRSTNLLSFPLTSLMYVAVTHPAVLCHRCHHQQHHQATCTVIMVTLITLLVDISRCQETWIPAAAAAGHSWPVHSADVTHSTHVEGTHMYTCLLYTSDAADE